MRTFVPFRRGSFVRLRSWSSIAKTFEVQKDSHGEYVRFSDGGIYRRPLKSKDRMQGIILDDRDRWKEIRMEDGSVVALPTAVLIPLIYKDGKFLPYHKKKETARISHRRWQEYMQDSIVRRAML